MKIKRIALNLISCFALLVSSIPSTAVFVSAETSGNGKAADPYTASNYDELTEALGKSGVDEDGVSYIKLTSGFSTDEFITVDFPKKVVIDGGSNAITGGGFNLKGNVTLKNLTFTTDNKKNAVIIGDAINANTVTLEGVTITQTAPSESKDIVTTIWINSKTNVTPNVTLKDCNITVNSNANVKDRARAIVLSDEETAGTGSGTLTLDNTTVIANEDQGGKAVGIDVLAKGANVKIQNGSKIIVPKRYGISVYSQNANITIDNSEVEAWGAIYFVSGTKDNYKSTSNTVNIQNNSKIKSVNPYSDNDNNFSAICFEGSSDSVTLDESSSIECKGSGEDGKAQFVASFYSTDNNKLTVNGSISTENNPSDLDLFFAYSQSGDIDNAPETPAVVIGEKATVPGFTLNDSEGNFKQTYDKLSEAVANAEENDIIVMGENSKEPEVKADKKLTIQRKGHTANVTSEKYDVIVSEESYVVDHKLVEKKAKKCDGTSEYTYYVCELCGKYFEDNKETEIEDIEAKVKELGNHKDLEKTSEEKEATCMETGITPGYKCKECGQIVIEPQVLNRNDNHSWPETWKGTLDDEDTAKGYTAVTNCKEGGWQVEECSRGCGAKHYKYVEPKEHEFGDAVIKEGDETDKEATCTEPGQKTKTCKNCPYEEKVTVPALNHKDSRGESTIVAVPMVEASCKGEGTEGHDRYWYCTQCKREEGTYESKHENDEYKWFSDAACTQEIVDHDSIFKTEEHDFSIVIPEKVPTCQSSGHHSYKQCSKCGDIEDGKLVSDFYAPANEFGHVYSSGLQGEATESTCLAKGKYQYFKCELCEKTYIVKSDAKDEWENYTDIEEIHPVGDTPSDAELALKPLSKHKWGTPVEYKAPDCEQAGNFGSVQCTVCNDKFKTTDKDGVAIENEDEYVKVTEDTELDIAALGHEWVDDAAHHFPDNCTTNEYYMCNREGCGKLAMVVTESEDTTILDSVKVKYITSEDEAKKPEASHSWVDKVTEAKEPNCTEDGTYAYAQCDKCGVFAEKLGDGSYKEWTVADDKNGDGVITEDDFVKKATGHDFESGFVKGYKSPDPCTQPGLNSYAVCQNDGCGVYALATLKAEANDGSDNPADYDYTPWTVEDNDKNSDGEITEDDFVIDVVGHIYGELHPAYTPEGAAACTENGKKAYYECSACKKLFIDEGSDKKEVTENELIVSAPGHQEEAIPASEDVAATCTGEGLTGGTRCSVCKTILTPRKVIPALGHDFKEESYKTKTPATCETKEIQEAKCSRCDVTQTREKPNSEPLGHDYQKVEAKEATCTEPGNIEYYKCSRCPKLFIDEEGAKKEITADKVVTTKDHEYGELIDEVAATCTNEGTKAHYKCSVCEKLFVDEEGGTKKEVVAAELVIEKIAHTPKTVDAVAATCTKTGLTEGSVCDVCGEVLVVQTATPMVDHTPVTDAAVEANCTMSGLTEGKHCSVCGGTLVAQVVTPALGHNYVNGVCTRDGAIEPNYGDNTSVDNGNSKPSNNSNNTVNNSNNNNNNITTAPTTKIPAKALKVKQAKVKKLKVKSKAKKTINVNWKKISGAKGYEVEVSKNSSFKKNARVVLKKTSKLKLTIKNKKIKSKKTYYVRVRAYTTYKSNGATVKAYSNWNYVLRKVKVK